jgi:hypothetical protein
MNRACKLLISLFYFNILFISATHAQVLKQDSASNTAIEKAESFFNSSIKQQSRLLNGPSFQNYGTNVEGSANFQDLTTFTQGDVIYDGFRFNNIPLMYDLYQDKVISLVTKSAMYSLVSEKLSDFYLNNHHFKYINVIDTTTSIIRPGFFDVIFDGKVKILAKRVKKQQYSIGNQDKQYYFVPKTTYYLERNDKYEIINGESSFMNLFKDKKNELKKHLKDKKIKFKKQPEEAMILLATHYESLPN